MFSARLAALVLAYTCFAACTAPSYAPSSHIANVTAGVSVPHPSTTGSVEAVTNGQNIYLCQNGVCNVCKAPGTGNVGTATTSANPDDAQPGGNILVANRSHHEIVQFNSACLETHTPYLDSGYYPNDVGVARSGTIAVANEYSTSYGPGNIKFYPKNANPYVAKGLFEFFLFWRLRRPRQLLQRRDRIKRRGRRWGRTGGEQGRSPGRDLRSDQPRGHADRA